MNRALKLALVLLAAAPTAWSFCGFYVAQEPGSLFNRSSKVVLARDGDRTVITMANDYRGDPAEFGLVIPVPQEITPEMVKVGDPAILAKLDQYTIPRMVEYFDPDPCPPPYEEREEWRVRKSMGKPSAAPAEARASRGDALGVTVERRYSLEEYEITVIRARHGEGLEQWLRQEGYRIPAGASPVLDSYVRQNMHFFLAKVDLSAQDRLGVTWPRPLRVSYTSPKFMLPIRLGTVNADGPQDLVIYALTPNGRVETTNYRTAKLPTDLEIPEHVQRDGRFNEFFTALFDRRVARDGMRNVYLEYAWPLSVVCDPCTADQLNAAELSVLGADWASDYHGGMNGGFVTRLHVRYDQARFPEDLVFQETRDTATFQARYVVNHPWTGDTSCPAGRAYTQALAARRAREDANLADLTGWRTAGPTAIPELGTGLIPELGE